MQKICDLTACEEKRNCGVFHESAAFLKPGRKKAFFLHSAKPHSKKKTPRVLVDVIHIEELRFKTAVSSKVSCCFAKNSSSSSSSSYFRSTAAAAVGSKPGLYALFKQGYKKHKLWLILLESRSPGSEIQPRQSGTAKEGFSPTDDPKERKNRAGKKGEWEQNSSWRREFSPRARNARNSRLWNMVPKGRRRRYKKNRAGHKN